MDKAQKNQLQWWILIGIMITLISVLHYTTPTMKWQYHLIFMQSYFIPILIGAFQFGIRGGIITAGAVTILYFPHVMLQWGGLVEENLMRFLQILLFNVIGYLTGLKAQREMEEKQKLQALAQELKMNYTKLQQQSEHLQELEEQLRLSDRLAVIGELTASLAHEIRNPLSAIRGAVEIIRDEVPEKMRNFEFFKILIDDTKRLSEVIENHLSYARRQKQIVTYYKINDVCSNSVLMLKNQAKKQSIEIELQLTEQDILLKGNSNDLRQILINLLMNSIQAIDGTGHITLRTEKYSPAENEHTLNISIIDTGHGLTEEEISKIFHSFYTTKPNGTGLGLAIVKRIVDNNKWHIEVNSIPKKETQFTLSIPLNNNR